MDKIKINLNSLKIIAIIVVLMVTIGVIGKTVLAKRPIPPFKIITYLPFWKKWQANEIDTEKLTHINLAFAGIQNGLVYDDIKPEQAKLIKKLQRKDKQIKILISIGGWGSEGFSETALTEESRKRFATSVTQFLRKYKLDGVDIDWEFPVSGNGKQKGRPEDKANFTAMMQSLRDELNQSGKKHHKQYLLTFAACINSFYIQSIELEKLVGLVDYINLMAYDFHGTWENCTGFHTNLYSTAEDPTSLSADLGVKRYLKAGVPPKKLILGTAFYGYGWNGVTNVNNGRYQPVTGECKSYSFQTLEQKYINRNGFIRYWDEQAKAPYLWNGDTFISYEDVESLEYRTMYVRANQLGGMMIWEYCHDMEGSLLNKIYRELSY